MKLCICTAVYNAGEVVRYVVRSILDALGDRYSVKPIVVDSGSVDGSPHIAIEEYVRRGYKPILIKGRFNVSQARNKCLEISEKENCDALIMIDHDVIVLDASAIELALDTLRMLGNGIIAVPYGFKSFGSIAEALNYIDRSRCSSRCIKLVPVPWTVTGLMIIPRKVLARVRFVERMNFRDDTIFGFVTWLKGVPIYMLKADGKCFTAIDVSIGRELDVYTRLGVSEYLSSIGKKVLSDVYRCSAASARGRRGSCIRLVAKYLAAASWIPGIVLSITLALAHLMIACLGLAMLSIAELAGLVYKEFRKVRKHPLALRNAIKISLFSLASIVLFPVVYVSKRAAIYRVMESIGRTKEIELCRG